MREQRVIVLETWDRVLPDPGPLPPLAGHVEYMPERRKLLICLRRY